MIKSKQIELIPEEIIHGKIFAIRGKKVMLDRDLAELYGVTTKRLNEQVKRNLKRFPEDFMIKLTKKEKDELVANCDRFNKLKHSTSNPYVFTEQGIAMLSSVLNSEISIQVNIQIIRVFIKLRQMLFSQKDIELKLKEIEKKLEEHDQTFYEVFYQMKQILIQEDSPKKQIGFNADEQ